MDGDVEDTKAKSGPENNEEIKDDKDNVSVESEHLDAEEKAATEADTLPMDGNPPNAKPSR